MIQLALASLRRFAREENGTSSIEFLFVFPIIFTTFVATFESGYFTMRYVMLDRALDLSVRELRLGMINAPIRDNIKTSICNKPQLIADCMNALTIELTQINTNTWIFPTGPVLCRDRGAAPPPLAEPLLGVQNQIMLIRACLAAEPMFPGAIIAANMNRNSVGDYFVTAVSAYVNEP